MYENTITTIRVRCFI